MGVPVLGNCVTTGRAEYIWERDATVGDRIQETARKGRRAEQARDEQQPAAEKHGC